MRLWEQPARQLPITQRPVPGETVVSYLRRLADANHLPRATLLRYLARCTTNLAAVWHHDDALLNPAAITRLAAISGLSTACLEHALPALTVPLADRIGPSMQPITSHASLGPYRPCSRCLARRGIAMPVLVHLPAYLHFCVEHAVWLRGHEPQPLTSTPELLGELARAQHRHRRLERRYGPDPARRVYRQAEQVVRGWLFRRWHVGLQARWDRRRSSLGLSEQVISDDELLMVTYPEAVALAGLFASSYWLSQIPSNWRDTWGPFLGEAGRRLGISYPSRTGVTDPLAGWIQGRKQRDRQRQPPDPLELAGLPESIIFAVRRVGVRDAGDQPPLPNGGGDQCGRRLATFDEP